VDFKRHAGVVHDTVLLPAENYGDVTVIAGDHDDDDVSLRVWVGGLMDVGLRVTAAQAIAIGRLLVAAGEDTASRQKSPADAGTEEVL
jgi:hypothetical protein